jgi:hypothetical protein
MECPVCYEALEGRATTTTPCSHAFHADCLAQWLERATTCPCWRTAVAAAPPNPTAEPPGFEWLEERRRRLDERITARIAATRAMLETASDALATIRATVAAQAEALAAKRLRAAQRSAATRAYHKELMQVALSKLPPAELAAREEQRKAKRSAAAKRGAATRAANRARAMAQ